MAMRIWAHNPSGERYVVEIDDNGEIVGAAGPLHYSEIAAALAGDWDSNPEVVDDMAGPSDYYDVTEAAQREVANDR